MTSPNTTTGWNATAGSNLTDHSQILNRSSDGEFDSGEDMAGDAGLRAIQIQRSEFYRNNYDYMTGVRIAVTLGGFFLFVLLTLLYKSKCKKSSREPTPIPLLSTPHPDLVVLTSTPSQQPIEEAVPMLSRHQQLLMDPQPGPSHYGGRYLAGPKVLLTAAHDSSESSIESELFLNNLHINSSLSSQCNKIPPLVGSTYTKKKGGHEVLTASARQMSLLQQSIDIHVIQPTPTISPSGSENIFQKQARKRSKKRLGEGRLQSSAITHTHHGVAAMDSDSGANNSLFFLQAENLSLKYMDDTSSENIPTRGSDFEDDSGGSLGSDSVFSFERKLSSASQSTQHDQDQDEEGLCRVTLTEAQAQVHHRDSFCSAEFESVTDYLEYHRRRSSSTQTTWSDLRRCLNLGPCATANISPRSSIGGGGEEQHLPPVSALGPNAIVGAANTSLLLTPGLLPQKKAAIAHISSSSSPLSNCSSRKQSIVSTQDEPINLAKDNSNLSQTSPPPSETYTIPTTATVTNSPSSNSSSQQQSQQQQGKSTTRTFQTLKQTRSVPCDEDKRLLQE